MKSTIDESRRKMLGQSVWCSAGVLLGGGVAEGSVLRVEEKKEEDVAPAEDLMREHGVLNRILLIYEHAQRRLHAAQPDFDAGALSSAAGIIQHFIEEYHEMLEEDYMFPRFERARKLTELVRVLREQHKAGRDITTQILGLTKPGTTLGADDRKTLDRALGAFIRMYRPHEAREDTVLFPALRSIISAHEYDALGDEFENKEHQLFGKEGFEGVVEQVAALERKLGLYELSQFTPRT